MSNDGGCELGGSQCVLLEGRQGTSPAVPVGALGTGEYYNSLIAAFGTRGTPDYSVVPALGTRGTRGTREHSVNSDFGTRGNSRVLSHFRFWYSWGTREYSSHFRLTLQLLVLVVLSTSKMAGTRE